MGYVLGIDGGATKTGVVIMDDSGAIVGQGIGGVGNYTVVGVEGVKTSVSEAVSQARQVAGLEDTPFDGVFFGMASVVSPADRALIRGIGEALQLASSDHIGVDHDCRIALAGGLSGRPGIVQICGTGSSTYGVNAAGEGWRTGGWGRTISDEGSSYWMAVQAMKAAVRAYDGRDGETALLTMVLDFWRIGDVNDIYRPLYVDEVSKTEVAQMAPLVIEVASAGDDTALAIIERGAELTAECVEAAARVLGMWGRPVEVALVGGIFSAGEITLEPFRQAVYRRVPDSSLVHAEQSPVVGAAILARQLVLGGR